MNAIPFLILVKILAIKIQALVKVLIINFRAIEGIFTLIFDYLNGFVHAFTFDNGNLIVEFIDIIFGHYLFALVHDRISQGFNIQIDIQHLQGKKKTSLLT